MLVTLAGIAVCAPASAGTATASATVKWYAQAVVKFALTPNYASGFGTVKATFGAQPAASPGPASCLNGCAVDFGPVVAGSTYLYKYAAHLNVTTNDANGFNVYGEGAADFTNNSDATTSSLNQTLYYLTSTSGGTDGNTGFTPGFPFSRTSGTVSGNSFSTSPSIAYGAYPAAISQSATSSGNLYYDYQLKVPYTATSGTWYVWIVYTVVPR